MIYTVQTFTERQHAGWCTVRAFMEYEEAVSFMSQLRRNGEQARIIEEQLGMYRVLAD